MTTRVHVRRVRKRLRDALIEANRIVESVDVDDPDGAYVLMLLHRFLAGDCKDSLATVADAAAVKVNRVVCAQGDENHQLVVPGLGTIEATWTGKRTIWPRSALVVKRLAARCADWARFDPDSGAEREEPVPPGAFAEYVAEQIASCAGLRTQSAAWRTTELEKRGIDPDEFREKVGESRPGAKWLG